MEEVSQLTEFGKVFIFLIIGIILILLGFGVNKLISLNKPNPEKMMSYECGEEPVGTSWMQYNSRFYVIALIFLLFDVELTFIFPWATIFGQQELLNADPRWGWLTLIEMFIFVGILILGLVYVWKKGDLEWIRPEPILPSVDSAVPASLYDKINQESYTVRPFSNNPAVPETPEGLRTTEPVTVPKPAFKPVFRKPAP